MEPRVLKYDSKGEGQPLVLVPGGLTGWLSWIPHQEALASRFTAIRVQPVYNELGSAGQPGDPTYGVATEREALRLTLDALGVESAHVAGWSRGGLASLEFTMAYPERVRTLTLIEPAAYWILEQLGERDAEVEELNAFMYRLAGQEVTEDDLAHFLRFAGLIQPGEDARQHPAWERWLPHRMALSWQSEQVDRSDRSIADLQRITCTVLLVKGTITANWLKRVVDVLGERLPNARVVELDGDHACHLQSSDRFLDELISHIEARRMSETGKARR